MPPPPPGQLPPQGQPNMQPTAQNPYGFILNAPHPPRRTLLKPNSLRSRLLLVVGAGFVVILAIIGISSLLTRTSQGNVTALKSLVAEQQEIIRVAGLGVSGSSELITQGWAETTKLSVTSQQKSLTKYLASKQVVLLPIELSAKKNSKIDAEFKTAKTNNRFNEVFLETLKDNLNAYAKDLKTSYQNASNSESKKILSDSYKSVTLLLK